MWTFDEKRLIALRESRGLSQTEFAYKLGLNTKQQINQWETGHGEYMPGTRSLLKIANAFDVAPAYFFTKTEDFKI